MSTCWSRWLPSFWVMVALLAAPLPRSASACPFCSAAGQTMLQAVDESDVAFIGELSGSKPLASVTPGGPDGETTAKLLAVLKPHPAVEKRSEIVLPRYIPAAEQSPVTFLVYALVADGAVDPYRATPLESLDFIDYMKGAVKNRNTPPAERIAYYFHYLDHSDRLISNDAYSEFALAPYLDVKQAKENIDPDKIIGWLHDASTEPYRIGLYGLLLGICGRPADRDVILSILEDPAKRPISGVDGLLGGLCVLDPDFGVNYVVRVLTSADNDFNYRYAALRTVKFLVSDMEGIDKADLFEKLKPAISIPDISDLVIDEFRRQQVWTPTATVLALVDQPEFKVQVVKRAITRYALKCPDPAALAFIKKLRADEPQFVQDVEEILRFEEAQQVRSQAATPPATP